MRIHGRLTFVLLGVASLSEFGVIPSAGDVAVNDTMLQDGGIFNFDDAARTGVPPRSEGGCDVDKRRAGMKDCPRALRWNKTSNLPGTGACDA